MIIERSFFERDTLTAARELLGSALVRETPEGVTRGIIVETEAYLGYRDDAAHSYRGRTERVRALYGDKGCAYVYLIYGMYNCLNISCGMPGEPECILIRALEPVGDTRLMFERRRTAKREVDLCSGPGKLCRAMDIDRELYGADLCSRGALYLEYGRAPDGVSATPRVGIDYAVKCRGENWRFCAEGNIYVSGKRQKAK